MGRNFATATELVREVAGELEHFGEMLPPQDRIILKRFYQLALNNRAAIANATSLHPFEVMLLLVILKDHKENERRYDELKQEVERLKRPPDLEVQE